MVRYGDMRICVFTVYILFARLSTPVCTDAFLFIRMFVHVHARMRFPACLLVRFPTHSHVRTRPSARACTMYMPVSPFICMRVHLCTNFYACLHLRFPVHSNVRPRPSTRAFPRFFCMCASPFVRVCVFERLRTYLRRYQARVRRLERRRFCARCPHPLYEGALWF